MDCHLPDSLTHLHMWRQCRPRHNQGGIQRQRYKGGAGGDRSGKEDGAVAAAGSAIRGEGAGAGGVRPYREVALWEAGPRRRNVADGIAPRGGSGTAAW